MSKTVKILVVEAKDLVAADLGGTSDPYVKFETSGKTKQTKVINKNLNPKWNEEVEIEWSGDRKIDVYVYDYDLASKDDFIGFVELWPATINEKADKWFDLKSRPGKSDKVTGQLHLKIVSVN